MMAVVFALAVVVIYLGPEARGVSFRKTASMAAVPE
jgi:hypothetical protein